MSTALTTKARIKERLQITVDDHDDVVDRFILAATDRIERMCNRRFMQATYTNELYDGSDFYGSSRAMLVLKNAPIASVSSIQYRVSHGSSATWETFDTDLYDIDMGVGIIHFWTPLPRGVQNIRVSYTAGYSGFSIGVHNYWVFNTTPAGTINGVNATFTLPAEASQVIVYADGVRIASANVSFTEDNDEFTLLNGTQPYSTIAVDYLPSAADPDDDDDISLPSDLVEVCESAVVKMFKRRDSDGRVSESLGESSITWTDSIFTKEQLATIKNYRRGSFV